MPPTTICLRCQSRLLWRQSRSKRQSRSFVSLNSSKPASESRLKQEDIIPPKQAEEESSNILTWPAREKKRKYAKNSENPREAILREIFDANRHKIPASSAFRYSRLLLPTTQEEEDQRGESLSIRSRSLNRISSKSSSSISTGPEDTYKQFTRGPPTADVFDSYFDKHSHSKRKFSLNLDTGNNQLSGDIPSVWKSERRVTGLRDSELDVTNFSTSNLSSASTPTKDAITSKSYIDLELPEADNESQTADTLEQKNSTPWNPDPLSFEFRRGVLAKDTKRINYLWQQFREHLKRGELKSKKLDTLFADFLWGFGHLHRMRPLQEVWSCMIEQEVTPATRHWNAVLEVLQKTRDLRRFELTWKKMLDAGCKPDNHSWTFYIVILLEQPYKDWRSAIRLLDDLGQWWRRSHAETGSQSQDSGADELPSIVPVNAAITGLLRLHLPDIAIGVLEWAQSFSIKINTFCYNIFLRYACQRGDTTGVASIINEMKKNGVKQDVVTKTIMLDSVIRNPDSPFSELIPSEQQRVVVENLMRMSNEGIPPNAQTFAITLQALLYQPRPNIEAARAVLELMMKQSEWISPHVFTILLMYHFKHAKPDLRALDTLWNMIETSTTRIDHVLYDRMIEGYASIGEVNRMLSFLKRMTDAGQVPGWLALERALAALTKKSEWKLCEQLVSDVTSDTGHLHVSKRGWRGEREFWQLVSELREQKLIPYKK